MQYKVTFKEVDKAPIVDNLPRDLHQFAPYSYTFLYSSNTIQST